MNDVLIFLGIESTAHTFGASLVADSEILTNVNSTFRPPTGTGIHPRKAAEHHAEVSNEVIEKALGGAHNKRFPDAVCYSAGPGLGPCLRVGATISRALAAYMDKPLVPVHHGIAHLDLAMMVGRSHDPLAVLISGGHTAIAVHMNRRWQMYGETEDITLGNLLDMFAREAGLPSPGGVSVEARAKQGHTLLPLPYTVKGNDVAYSGLLTAALRLVSEGHSLADICFSIQEVGFAMLAEAVERSLAQTRKKEVLLAGGVAANQRLREMIRLVALDHKATFHPIPIEYSGDCGAQIACSGKLAFESGVNVSIPDSFVNPRWRLDEIDVPWIPRP